MAEDWRSDLKVWLAPFLVALRQDLNAGVSRQLSCSERNVGSRLPFTCLFQLPAILRDRHETELAGLRYKLKLDLPGLKF